MIRKILIPLDGSTTAEIALPFAEEIAVKSPAGIILITAAGPESQDLEPLYRSYLERTAEKVQARLALYGSKPAATPDIHLMKGPPAEGILRYADEISADLIIMANRGSSNHAPWLLGSIATKVTMASSKPVLVIKNPAPKAAIEQKKILKRILVPLDGSEAGEAALPFTEALARVMGSELILFHAVQPAVSWAGYAAGGAYASIQEPENASAAAQSYLESLRKQMAGKGLSVTAVAQDGSPAELIIDYARNEAIDAIAISTHGRSGVSRWVLGSVTERVLQNGKSSVLVVHASKG